MNQISVGDGLDPVKWDLLCEGVSATHAGDASVAHSVTDRLAAVIPYDGQFSTCLWYLLRYRVAQLVGGRPSAEDLRRIAARSSARFHVVIRDGTLLEKVLRTVFKLASEDEEVVAGQFIVAGMTALGVLVDDPVNDLEAIRPQLADWWRRNLEKFRAQGILEDRSQRQS